MSTKRDAFTFSIFGLLRASFGTLKKLGKASKRKGDEHGKNEFATINNRFGTLKLDNMSKKIDGHGRHRLLKSYLLVERGCTP